MISSKKSKNVERWEEKNYRRFLKCRKKSFRAKKNIKKCPFPALNSSCYYCNAKCH